MADDITSNKKQEITFEDVEKFVEAKARALTHPIFGRINSDARNKSIQIRIRVLEADMHLALMVDLRKMLGKHSIHRAGTAYTEQAQCKQGRHNLHMAGTAYTGQAQCKQNKHNIYRAGTAYTWQAQHMQDRHNVYRAGITFMSYNIWRTQSTAINT